MREMRAALWGVLARQKELLRRLEEKTLTCGERRKSSERKTQRTRRDAVSVLSSNTRRKKGKVRE